MTHTNCIRKLLFLSCLIFGLSACGLLNSKRLENYNWKLQLTEDLVYHVQFKEEVAHFTLDQDIFLESASQSLDLTAPASQQLLKDEMAHLNKTARYHLEGNQLDLIQSSHQAKAYKIYFEDRRAILEAKDGQQLILEREP